MGRAELKPLLTRLTERWFLTEVDCRMLEEGGALAEAFVTHTVLVTQLLCLSSRFRLGNKAHAEEKAALTRRPLVWLLLHVNPLTHDKV